MSTNKDNSASTSGLSKSSSRKTISCNPSMMLRSNANCKMKWKFSTETVWHIKVALVEGFAWKTIKKYFELQKHKKNLLRDKTTEFHGCKSHSTENPKGFLKFKK